MSWRNLTITVQEAFSMLQGLSPLFLWMHFVKGWKSAKLYSTFSKRNPQAIVTVDVSGWEEAVGCPDSEQLFNTIIDSGCPQVKYKAKNNFLYYWFYIMNYQYILHCQSGWRWNITNPFRLLLKMMRLPDLWLVIRGHRWLEVPSNN